jgi:hypothetical protein
LFEVPFFVSLIRSCKSVTQRMCDEEGDRLFYAVPRY